MSIKVESTTDTEAQVLEAMGNKVEDVEDKTSDAEEKTSDETTDESETSEKEDLKAKDESEEKDSDEDEAEDQKDSKEVAKKKSGNGFQKKINKLNREIEYWKSAALNKSGQQEPQAEKQELKAVSNSDKPNPDKFDTHDEYVEALTDWKIEQREKEREVKAKEESAKTEFQKKQTSFQSKVQEFESKVDDFQEALESVDDIPMSVGVQETILSSEIGPELMYELAKDREEYERINALSPLLAARELGKFEAKLLSKKESPKPKVEEKKQTKAPPPMKPVGSKSSHVLKDPDEMSYQEFKQWREAR